MPVIFKIMVFLILQQGIKTASDISGTGTGSTVNLGSVLPARSMIFSVQAGEASVNQIISIATAQDRSFEVRSASQPDGMTRVEIIFKQLTHAQMDQLITRFRPLLDRVQFQWMEQQ